MDGESTTAPGARIPVACSLDDLVLARRSDQVRRELFAGAEERIELADGYAFRFPAGGEWKRRIDEFVDVERRCCQFFRIEVSYEPGLGPIWLRLTGPEGTKAFVAETF
ncbi:MAG TPA: hypothetical protein VGT61_11260 [Thermomicrobiales bacterium]|jgi:hypothetical protein|nr:hypothetical protein [Thermomicrobiales bacterium]